MLDFKAIKDKLSYMAERANALGGQVDAELHRLCTSTLLEFHSFAEAAHTQFEKLTAEVEALKKQVQGLAPSGGSVVAAVAAAAEEKLNTAADAIAKLALSYPNEDEAKAHVANITMQLGTVAAEPDVLAEALKRVAPGPQAAVEPKPAETAAAETDTPKTDA